MKRPYASVAVLVLGALAAATAQAELSSEELAKLAQNPIANLISVPFQNNVNLNFGTHVFHLGRLPVNAQVGGYYNVIRPDFDPNRQIRAHVQFMFPK